MIRFECDYAEGAHPRVLAALCDTNFEQTPGYGEDAHCARAAQLIRVACAAPDAAVHFLVGGTQANFVVISSVLRPHEGALCADSGHINVHETGAVEATGHKVLALPGSEGKITAAQVREAVAAHYASSAFEHTVKPGIVYISHPTEFGTLYTKAELEALSAACRELKLPLFLDGARLGYGLAAETDLTLQDIARLCDVFYIGGTKVGALFGEAVVITNKALQPEFRYGMKQRGAMLAKGRLLGLQFEALFTDGLYLEIARGAVAQAMRIKRALQAKGIPLPYDSSTNQQFCILTEGQYAALSQKYALSDNGPVPGGRLLRICTSWATRSDDVDALLADLAALA